MKADADTQEALFVVSGTKFIAYAVSALVANDAETA
jgi:hypothetical protein